jgi:lantibiotic biosynthesis protein
MSTEWKPLLQGELAEQARQTVQEIAAALKSNGSTEGARSSSLAGGQAGEALFYTYLALQTGDEAAAEQAAQLVEQAAEALAVQPLPPNLYTGFAGVAWTMEHLRGRLFEEDGDEDDPVEEIDEALAIPLQRSPWPGDYDLITGLVGLAVYALERLPRPAAVNLLAQIVDRLSEKADVSEEGAAWFTRPEELPEWQREYHPRGSYNLGVAHGLPAVVAVLAGAAAAGVEKARPLLADSVRFLLARRQDPSTVGACFSTSYAPWEAPTGSRLAWCYGDPGVAAALLAAARAVGEPAWEREALEIALLAAERPESSSGIRDAGICHGAAGLGHLFNRMYNTTGEERLREAAHFWFERTLALKEPGQGIGGFRTWGVIGEPNELGWREESGFLDGTAGVGLALLGALSDVEPAWDRILTISVRTVDR